MKKTKLLLTLLCLCAYVANAQEQGSIEFGVGGGINFATITEGNNTNDNGGVRTAFNAGVFGDFFFSDRWSLKVKALYDSKGWKNGYVEDYDSYTYSEGAMKLNYVTVPVMANFHFGKTRNWYVNFGPYVGFLTSANIQGYDAKPLFNSVDAGLAFGIGVKIPISERCKFFVEYDGQAGLANIAKESDGYSFKNSRFGFNVGVAFPLK
ncbi:MAG: hypothetical protein DI598_04530 [Pseudopedobacter saltans]|uniref:Outer membrane protein beta-barrel domain-containing protein n=1 Tax=Pseudopedobacter saltans TaxID=151895 RepID=A0A2W5GYL9_9SPHI|nr:MAG: hypothetical protein DI598_04530 [Pseudopedobacter saltans]